MNSADPVIRNIAGLRKMIQSDSGIKPTSRRYLLIRLDREREAYLAWQAQYSSYFTTPKFWTPPLAPMPKRKPAMKLEAPAGATSGNLLREYSGDRPTVTIFADFAGFTHRVRCTDSDPDRLERQWAIDQMITGELYDYMVEWSAEFDRKAWADAMEDKPGTMLWTPFDLQGMSIARAVKATLGNLATVQYIKPSEDPFMRYEEIREVGDDFAVTVVKSAGRRCGGGAHRPGC